jgi:tetratricopeptide (TPR) repeat protein
LSLRISTTIAPELERIERQQLDRLDVPDLDAWGWVQKGWSLVDRFNKESVAAARQCFEQALMIDPSYCQAHIGISRTHCVDFLWNFTEDVSFTRDAAMKHARKAVELDNQEARSHWILALAYHIREQFDRAISENTHALNLNPSLNFARFSIGAFHFLAGRPAEGYPFVHSAIQLNPRDPRNFVPYMLLAAICFDGKEYTDAERWAENAIRLKIDLSDAYLLVASCQGHQGRNADAAVAYAEYIRLREANVSEMEMWAVRHLDQNHLLEGLHRAGLREN